MRKTRSLTPALAAALILTAAGILTAVGPDATLAKGPNDPATECLIQLQNDDETAATRRERGINIVSPTITCIDGAPCDLDGATNGSCTWAARACVNTTDRPGCTGQPLKKVKVNPKKLGISVTPNGASSVCGAFTDVVLNLKKKGRKPSKKQKITAIAKAEAKGNKDVDKVKVQCLPCPTDNCTGASTTTTTLPGTQCNNPDGGPSRMTLTIGPSGTDLDNGWTGSSHNFILVPNGKVDGCLTNCNSTSDTLCDFTAPTGPGTVTGTTFGAPLPLLASNVPVCVVSKWREPTVTGTADEATGDMSLDIRLTSEVFLTDLTAVCPQCRGNPPRCNSGANANRACEVEATVPVFISQGNIQEYRLSSTCVPTAPPEAALEINFLPLTSGQAAPLVGPVPCNAKQGEPQGVQPPQPDSCGGAGCGSICTGLACQNQIDDPVNPGNMICADSKGGVSQLCCNNNTTKPCFTLANGGTVNRAGNPDPPLPALPDTTYPKTSAAGVLASTFCIPATGSSSIDQVTGLPGPGAIQLTGTADWNKQ